MMMSDDLKQRIEAIESGYEFMLAYAAQGRETDKGAAAGRNVREYLDKMVAALENLSAVVGACANGVDPDLPKTSAALLPWGISQRTILSSMPRCTRKAGAKMPDSSSATSYPTGGTARPMT